MKIVLVLVVPTSLAAELSTIYSKSYVGQAVLVLGRIGAGMVLQLYRRRRDQRPS